MRLPRPRRSRRRLADGIDVGFRLSGALGGIALWGFLVVLMATSEVRSSAWLVAVVVCGLPFISALVFALLTAQAHLDDRGWDRAQRGYSEPLTKE